MDLAYEYGMIDGMAVQLKGFVGQLDSRLTNDVDKEFQTLCDNGWDGDSARAFHAAKTEWHGKCTEMSTTLTQLHGVLGNANTDMQSKDKSLMSLFG
jgi:WXG100 family type VII secretion target